MWPATRDSRENLAAPGGCYRCAAASTSTGVRTDVRVRVNNVRRRNARRRRRDSVCATETPLPWPLSGARTMLTPQAAADTGHRAPGTGKVKHPAEKDREEIPRDRRRDRAPGGSESVYRVLHANHGRNGACDADAVSDNGQHWRSKRVVTGESDASVDGHGPGAKASEYEDGVGTRRGWTSTVCSC